ncbi:MAG: lysophospholipid acyltransferase family protein [Thermodesulfobacteriota bacterium]
MTIRAVFQWTFIALLTLVLGVPAALIGMIAPGRHRKGKIFLWLSKIYSGIALFVFGVKVEVRGLDRVDRSAPYVFMANHISYVDPPSLAYAIPHPMFWVFKKELARIPVFGWVLLSLGQIMVDRSDARQARGAMANAAEGLRGNQSILIYPEGTRSKDGNLQPLKKGGFHIAIRTGLPIVPVRISGSGDVLPHGAIAARPGRVVVELFDPIPTAGRAEAEIPELMARVRDALVS